MVARALFYCQLKQQHFFNAFYVSIQMPKTRVLLIKLGVILYAGFGSCNKLSNALQAREWLEFFLRTYKDSDNSVKH